MSVFETAYKLTVCEANPCPRMSEIDSTHISTVVQALAHIEDTGSQGSVNTLVTRMNHSAAKEDSIKHLMTD